MDSKEFAKYVHGKVAANTDTGVKRASERALKKINGSGKIPTFKDSKAREDFYRQYIPALYFFEIEHLDPKDIIPELIESFWLIFDLGTDIFNMYITDKGGE